MLRPYPISPKHFVPTHIDLPDWPLDGNPKIEPNSDLQRVVEIKTSDQIAIMRETCRIAREVLDVAARMIRPDVATDEIDRAVHDATNYCSWLVSISSKLSFLSKSHGTRRV